MKRVLTALLLIPIPVYAALSGPWWFFLAVVAVVAMLCFAEYARMTGSFAPLGYVAGALILVAPPRETMMLIILSTLAALCLPLWSKDVFETTVPRSAALALGIVYVFGSWKTAVLLHDGFTAPGLLGIPAGHHWLIFGLVMNWVGDSGAYYAGRAWGRHKLAPHVSPGKTWEGAIASALTGVAFGLIYIPLGIKGVAPLAAAVIALLTNAAGQIGDLAESAIKRGVGVKDSGSLLPGHGGFLDRVDSTLFALPVLYTLVGLMDQLAAGH